MKKYIYKIGFLAIIAAGIFTSCDEDTVTYNGENFATLATPSFTTLRIPENVGVFKMAVSIAFPVSNDVTITYEVTSDVAVEGVDYTSATSVVIPAGQVTTDIVINVIDNEVLDDSKPLQLKLTSISDSSISLGIANVGSTTKTGLIVNDDCTTEFSIWFGDIVVSEGGSSTASTGGVNAAGDCNILVVTGDVFGFGAEDDKEIPILLTPSSEGATSGTVTIDDQLYCQACSSNMNVNVKGTGTYNEVTKVITVNYTITRSDSASATGTITIRPAN